MGTGACSQLLSWLQARKAQCGRPLRILPAPSSEPVPTTTVWLEQRGGETVVHVKDFGRLGGGIQIDSCNKCGHLTAPDWDRPVRNAINSRLASDGLDKGRVLFARFIQFPSPDLIPVGAATLHLDDQLVRVLHLGHVKGILSTQRYSSSELLLSCCCVIAREHGCNGLEMLLHNQAQVASYCRGHGFRRVARRGNRYGGLRHNDYLVEKLVAG